MIRVKTKACRSWPLRARNLVKDAAYWVSKELKVNIESIDVCIKLMGYRDDLRGDCIRLAPNKYLIHIHAKHDRPTATLFHEFVHIKQHIYDGFELLEDNRALWRNAPYPFDWDDYWTLPWEKEASRIEIELSKRFRLK